MTTIHENIEKVRTENSKLRRENSSLRKQVAEMQELLTAIKEGNVDAFVLERENEPQVFTLEGAERPFRTVVETMNEGAATISDAGVILYCNQRFADILGLSLNEILGKMMADFLSRENQQQFERMSAKSHTTSVHGELTLLGAGEREVAVYAALSPLENAEVASVCMVITDITDLKRKNKELLGEALRAGRMVAFEWNPQTDRVTRSENASDMLGFEASKSTGTEHFSLIHPQDRESFIELVRHLTPESPQYRRQYRLLLKDGTVTSVEETGEGVFDADGKMVLLHGLFVDVTERGEIEEALRRAQSVAKLGSWRMNVRTNELIWSNETYRIFGVDPQTPLNYEFFLELIHPNDRAIVDRAWKAALESRRDYTVQHRIVVEENVKWIQEVGELEFDENGGLTGAFGTAQDITQQKETQQELLRRTAQAEEGKRLLDAIMENIPIGMTIVDTEARIRAISRSALELIGSTREEIDAASLEEMRELWQVMLPGDGMVPTDELPILRAIQEGQVVKERELAVMSKQQKITPVLATAAPIRDNEGRITEGIVAWQDISQRKEDERKLQQRTAEAEKWARLLDMIMEHVPVGILVAEAPDVRVQLISRFGAYLLNQAQRSEFEGTLVSEQREQLNFVKSAVQETGLLPLTQAVQEGTITENQEFALDLAAGKRLHLLVSAGPIRNAKDEIMGGILVWQDITELKRAERSLQESRRNLLELKEQLENKNKELESIIGVVSHDLRSPLVSISGFTHEIRLSTENAQKIMPVISAGNEEVARLRRIVEEEIPEFIDYIQSSTSRMDMLVRSLVKVARAGMAEIRLERVNMNELVAEATAAMGFEVKESGTELIIEDLPECFADKNQTSQIIANLVDNAVKYLDPDRPGRIRIYGYTQERHSAYCVEDNGTGIAQEHLNKIFDLFSRLGGTKAKGEGIGLAMVKRLVERNNGSIRVESEVGKGTTFCVLLPQPGLA
ncbi:MAG: PAS domain S-box protein [Planctomycetaceae bacterium]|nr:PAS domain S-box protein [Planctomycetaceae bacterium]